MKRTLIAIFAAILATLFFSSCSVFEIEEPVPSLPPVTDTGPTSVITDTGFSITYPEGWTVLSQEQINKIYESIIENLKQVYKDPLEYEKYKDQNVPVSMAMLHPVDYTEGFNPNVNIVVQSDVVIRSDIVSFASQVLEEGSKQINSGIFEFGEVQPCKVGGLDAAVVDMKLTQRGMELAEKQYYVYRNKHLIFITLCDTNPAGLDILQRAVDNIRFN